MRPKQTVIHVVAFLLAAVLLAPGAARSKSAGARGLPEPVYLALGDSLAIGVGATEPDRAGYVALFHQFLRAETDDRLVPRNVSARGATSGSLIREGQLASALDVLRRNEDDEPANDVRVITIDIGGDDLRTLVRTGAPCQPPVSPTDPSCVAAVVGLIADYRANITTILQSLRSAAGPATDIFALNVMNPYSGTGGPLDEAADPVIRLLNTELQVVADDPSARAVVIDVFPLFVGRAYELTHLDEARPDFHPNDTGHRLMAEAIITAYRERRTPAVN